MVMGVIYLMYSAYFLAGDIEGMLPIVNFLLAMVYIIIGVVNYRALYKKTKLIKNFLIDGDG